MKKMIFRSIILLTLFIGSGLGKVYANSSAVENAFQTESIQDLMGNPQLGAEQLSLSHYYISHAFENNRNTEFFEQTEEEERAKVISSRKQITGNSYESQFEVADQDYLLNLLKVVPSAARQSNTGPTTKWFLLFEVFRI